MINCENFYNLLLGNGIGFFAGVPDSLLKNICAYISDNVPSNKHTIAANEGGAIALASGYHLATGGLGLVYMQNSGEGNAVNPLVSLADPAVYSIPMLIMIGWRGEPGEKDEPQHIKQGKITLDILDALEIPYGILPQSDEEAASMLSVAIDNVQRNNAPYAIVVRKGTFEPYKLKNKISPNSDRILREEAISIITKELESKDVVVSTTGMTSRELFESRDKASEGHNRDFLTVGSMGHSSQIALGIAITRPDRQVYCLDGDGALIMHMGSLAIIGSKKPKNFKHIVINNGSHESVGGQPTAGFVMDIPAIAKACGYNSVFVAESPKDIKEKMSEFKKSEGPALLEIKVNQGHRENLGRPTTTPAENKEAFMKFLES